MHMDAQAVCTCGYGGGDSPYEVTLFDGLVNLIILQGLDAKQIYMRSLLSGLCSYAYQQVKNNF